MSITNYIYKKFFYICLMLITVTLVSFFSVKLIPGDPITAMFGQKGSDSPEQRAIEEKKLGLDKNILEQFKTYLINIFKFNFGNSYKYRDQTAFNIFWPNFKKTCLITFLSCIFGSLIGIFFGSLSALWKNTKKNFILNFIFMFLLSTPTFIIGYTLQYFLGFRWKLFEISSSIKLPILTLSLVVSGSIFKITFNNMNETLKQPYITTAYAKGLSTKTVVFKHALKNALISILAQIGLIVNFLISGSIITEFIFDIQGIGKLTTTAFEDRDYPIIQCCIILLSICISIFNILLDLIYFWLNPTINKKV